MPLMNQPLFWRSLGVQALAITVLFATLLALPLERGFFRDWGALLGPVSWAVCSLITARVLSLPWGLALFAALAGGMAGLLVGLVAGHAGGLVESLLVFAASCAGYEGERGAAAATRL